MNSLGTSKETIENKLILLYIIDRLKMPVSNIHITKIILENRFMNYFLLQQFLNELCEDKFLQTEISDERRLYKLTQNGRQALGFFSSLIPQGLKSRMDEVFREIRRNIRSETLIKADYIPESENKFTVTCKVGEDDFSLLELSITTGTKTDSRLICENWLKHSQEIYSEIIESLTKKRD